MQRSGFEWVSLPSRADHSALEGRPQLHGLPSRADLSVLADGDGGIDELAVDLGFSALVLGFGELFNIGPIDLLPS